MIEKRELGTQDDPDIIPMGNQVEIFPEPSREDQVRDAAMVLVAEEGLLIDDEIDAMPEMPQAAHDENLVEYLDRGDLMALAGDVLSSIKADRESRSDWEKTYVDGLKYLGMRF